ncbi:MAG: STAS domain-containing protein [Solibacillus sp.]
MSKQEAVMKMQIKREYLLITFAGNLEYGKIEEIKKELHAHMFDADADYVIDMQQVNNVDSTGFGMIVNFAKKVSVRGKKIVIIVADEFIRNLFAISQCDKVFPIVKDEVQAHGILKNGWQAEISISEY